MNKTLTLEQADNLVTADDRYWWETFGKTLVHFRPARGAAYFRKDAYFNRQWRSKNKWGTVRRFEVGDDGLFNL